MAPAAPARWLLLVILIVFLSAPFAQAQLTCKVTPDRRK